MNLGFFGTLGLVLGCLALGWGSSPLLALVGASGVGIFLAGLKLSRDATAALALHPESQERVRREVLCLAPDGDIRADVYPKLRWTNAVVKEATRLYPPVCSMHRDSRYLAVIGLGVILSRFHLTLAGDQEAEPSAWITLRPMKPILLRLLSAT